MLWPQLLGEREELRAALGMEDNLKDSRAIAQIDEDQSPVIAAPMNPASDARLAADLVGSQITAPTVAVLVWLRRTHQEIPRPRSTAANAASPSSNCVVSPLSKSFSSIPEEETAAT